MRNTPEINWQPHNLCHFDHGATTPKLASHDIDQSAAA
jgi:hypothetical protein